MLVAGSGFELGQRIGYSNFEREKGVGQSSNYIKTNSPPCYFKRRWKEVITFFVELVKFRVKRPARPFNASSPPLTVHHGGNNAFESSRWLSRNGGSTDSDSFSAIISSRRGISRDDLSSIEINCPDELFIDFRWTDSLFPSYFIRL